MEVFMGRGPIQGISTRREVRPSEPDTRKVIETLKKVTKESVPELTTVRECLYFLSKLAPHTAAPLARHVLAQNTSADWIAPLGGTSPEERMAEALRALWQSGLNDDPRLLPSPLRIFLEQTSTSKGQTISFD